MKIVCGVDVSKARLDAAVLPGKARASFDNDPEGVAALGAFCRQHSVQLVAMEATGGLERLAFLTLWGENIACALVNPRNVRRFAEALGALEKTDAIDAAVIARFAGACEIEPTPPPSRAQQRFSALVARLRQITDDLVVQKQRRAAATDDETRESLDETIAFFRRQSKKLEGEIASMIDDDPLWSRLSTAFREIKGVADRTVAMLVAQLPEIGTYNNKAIAKLAGLAPLADDSGGRSGKRRIRGGRAGVRAILFLVALGAARFDEKLKDFRDRLTKAGKPKMVVRIALAHKLLVRLNAKARDARAEFANAT